MRLLVRLARLPALALAISVTGSSAIAQEDQCAGISERYEDALARMDMVATRRAILRDLNGAANRPEIVTRIDNEIAALSRDAQGVTPEAVVDSYLVCRFDVDLGTGPLADLVNSPQTFVGSNCKPCEGALMAANDAFDTLYTVSREGSSMGVLRSVLDERDRAIVQLLTCEQNACRDTALKDMDATITAADFLSAFRANNDSDAWAAAPIVVTDLPDYAAMTRPVGQYPVIDGSGGQ